MSSTLPFLASLCKILIECLHFVQLCLCVSEGESTISRDLNWLAFWEFEGFGGGFFDFGRGFGAGLSFDVCGQFGCDLMSSRVIWSHLVGSVVISLMSPNTVKNNV